MNVRRGFTLPEVLLAIALSALVLYLVTMAIRVHLRATDTRRTQIEEARLARAVLQQIADDLRGTVQYKAVDFSGVEQLAGLSGGLGGEPFDDLELDELEGLLGDEGEDEAETERLDADGLGAIGREVAPRAEPGLYGNRYELQLDVSRIPRVDEYDILLRPAEGLDAVSPPSDLKTVSYFVIGTPSPDAPLSASTGGVSGFQTLESPAPARNQQPLPRGLVRRSLDRAVTQFAVEMGDLEGINRAGQLLAPEVVAIEFRYTDGLQWYDAWDTAERGGLPVAVQVAVAIDMHAGEREQRPLLDLGLLGDDFLRLPEQVVYHLTVHLPMAEPPQVDELFEEEFGPEEDWP